MNIKYLIKEDLYRYTGDSRVSLWVKKRFYGWQYTKFWRKANYYYKKNKVMYLLYGLFTYRKSIKYGFQISPQATIGRGLYIGHFGSVIVGNEVKIGSNVNLGPNIVIGATNRGEKKGSPVIGNRCWIGSGAVVVGGIKIGDNVLIAPNSYVNIDIPSNSIVMGNPARIISRADSVEGYINNMVGER